MRFQPASFRPAFGRALTVVVLAIAASGFVGFAVTGDLEGLLRYGSWLLLLGALGPLLFWMPRVDVQEHEITIRNPFSTWHIAWHAIQIIDTKYALTLTTPKARIEAWAAPASGRFTAFTLGPDDTKVSESARVAGTIRPGDTLNSESGAAANSIRRHWEQLRDDGLLDRPFDAGDVRREWHSRTLIALGVVAALGVLGLAL